MHSHDHHIKIIVALLLSALIFVSAFSVCAIHENAHESIAIEFADKNLEAAIRHAIGKDEGKITAADAAAVTELNLSKSVQRMLDSFMVDTSHNITNLDGLQHFTSLEKLDLQGNNITDIPPLKSLKSLKELNLCCNSLQSIEALGSLENLEKLNISWNGISDIGPLEKLTRLKELWLGSSSMLAPVAYNQNKISDVSALKDMSDMEVLDLQELDIKDIDALKEMRKLKKLLLRGNEASDLASLQNLAELEYLDISGNNVQDINPLAEMTKLEYLYLRDNKIEDIDPLSNLKALKELDMGNNSICSIEALAGMTRLKKLVLQENKVEEVGALANMAHLEHLILTNNRITGVDALGGLKRLKVLHLYGNRIENINPLGELNNLETLNIGENPIKDYSPLEKLDTTNIYGINFPFFKEPPDRGDVPDHFKWNPYTGGYYDPTEVEWDVKSQSYFDVKSYRLPAVQIGENNRISENNKFSTNGAVTLASAKELIAEHIIESGTKGDVEANLMLEEITVKEAWYNGRLQIYRVELDYAWLHGVAVIKDGKVVCVLEGMPTYEVFLADIDKDNNYEIYTNISMGSGIVSNEIRGYNISSGTKYALSMRAKRDLSLFIKDGMLYVKQFEYPARKNQQPVEINTLVITKDGKLGLGLK